MAYNRKQPFNDLPNLPPAFDFNHPAILNNLVKASRQLGELNGLCSTLPEPTLLINTIVLQESRDSSAIENIVTTQDELFQAVANEKTFNDAAKEVLRYRQAIYRGLELMDNTKNLITTNTLIQIVQTIKENQSGVRNAPGTALKNAITGEVIYTPPCCEDEIREKLKALEKFVNDEFLSDLDPLIKMALIHYQFESIHPFFDGNGRTGRILNVLYLVQQKLLPQPVLYLSSYINKNKSLYYRLLREVTEAENWQDWVMFILTSISETARLTAQKIRNILQLKKNLEEEVKEVLGVSYNYELVKMMFTLPYLKIELLEKNKIAHRQTASNWLKKLANANILNTKKIGKTNYYVNWRLLEILSNE
ncbi:MAG: Fic family protein [Bacteroidota bacterium]